MQILWTMPANGNAPPIGREPKSEFSALMTLIFQGGIDSKWNKLYTFVESERDMKINRAGKSDRQRVQC